MAVVAHSPLGLDPRCSRGRSAKTLQLPRRNALRHRTPRSLRQHASAESLLGFALLGNQLDNATIPRERFGEAFALNNTRALARSRRGDTQIARRLKMLWPQPKLSRCAAQLRQRRTRRQQAGFGPVERLPDGLKSPSKIARGCREDADDIARQALHTHTQVVDKLRRVCEGYL